MHSGPGDGQNPKIWPCQMNPLFPKFSRILFLWLKNAANFLECANLLTGTWYPMLIMIFSIFASDKLMKIPVNWAMLYRSCLQNLMKFENWMLHIFFIQLMALDFCHYLARRFSSHVYYMVLNTASVLHIDILLTPILNKTYMVLGIFLPTFAHSETRF